MGKVHRYATMRKYLVLLCLFIFCNTESDSSPIVEVQLEDQNFSPATTIQRYELFRKSGLALVEDKKKILEYFELIENLKLSKEKKNLIHLKKSLFLIENLEVEKGKDLLNKLIQSETNLKSIAEEIYFD